MDPRIREDDVGREIVWIPSGLRPSRMTPGQVRGMLKGMCEDDEAG